MPDISSPKIFNMTLVCSILILFIDLGMVQREHSFINAYMLNFFSNIAKGAHKVVINNNGAEGIRPFGYGTEYYFLYQ